jgi:CHAT domain-containing protein
LYAQTLGLAEVSRTHFRQAYETFKRDKQFLNAIEALQRLAVVDEQAGDAASVLAEANEVVSLCKTYCRDSPSRFVLAYSFLTLGNALRRLHRFDDAEKAFQQARATVPGDQLATLGIPVLLARMRLAQQRYDEALSQLLTGKKERLATPFGITDTRDLGEESAVMAIAQAGLGDFDAAVGSLERSFGNSIVALRQTFRFLLEPAREADIVANVRSLDEQVDAIITLDAAYGASNLAIRLLACVFAMNRIGIGEDLLVHVIDSLQKQASSADRDSLRRLRDRRADLARAVRLRAKRGGGGEATVEQIERDIRGLEQRLLSEYSHLTDGFDPIALASVQRKLAQAETAALVIIKYRDLDEVQRYRAYVIGGGNQPLSTDLGDAKSIIAAVTSYRTAMTTPERSGPDRRRVAARDLGRAVLDPIDAAIKDVKRAIIVTDTDLSLVPFSGLITRQGKFLGEQATVTYAPSVRSIVARLADEETPLLSPPVMVINPELDNKPSEPAPGTPIPSYRDVAREILDRDAAAVVRTDEGANSASVRAVAAPRFVHIASHGFFDATPDRFVDKLDDSVSPMLRGGVMVGIAKGDTSDDGILGPLDFARMNLKGTKLVFISACSTAEGTPRSGEGVYGIRRGLELAGSESQILSLWPVDQDATALLVKRFYDYWLSGESEEVALQRAQADVRSRNEWSDPFYWAAFVLSKTKF